MLIAEVTAAKPQKPPPSPQQQRVATLKRQLDQARAAAKGAKIHQQQQRLNQQRAALNSVTAP